MIKKYQGLFDIIKDFIFKNFDVDVINLQHTLTPFDNAEHTQHCHVELPDTIEEFDNNLSHRVRYNTKWYPKKIQENIGEISFEKIDAKDCPKHIFDLYFQWKYESHNRRYHITSQQYIKQYSVTSVYVLCGGKNLLAIGFVSETADNVYFENFSYNQKYKKYSPGMVLYYEIICDLIKRHKKIFYLLSVYDYKIHYNGIITETYTGHIYKSQQKIKYLTKMATILKKLPKFVRKIIILVYSGMFLSRPYKHFLKDEVNK